MSTNTRDEALRAALVKMVKAACFLRDRVIETRGVKCMDDMDAAITEAEAALAASVAPASAPVEPDEQCIRCLDYRTHCDCPPAPPAGAVEDAAQLRAFADRIDLMLDSTGGQVSVAAWRLMAHEMRRRAEGAPKLQAPDEAQLLGECERCGSDAWCVRCDPPSWAGDLILAHRTAQQAFTSDNPPKALFAAIEQDLRRVMTALWGKK